jgi:hypothetical protein
MKYGAKHPDYQRNHVRVKRQWGKASDWQCILCFDRAHDWAHLWRTHPDPYNPDGYVPMCRQDHVDYDNVAERVRAEVRSPRRRAMAAKQVRRNWQDPEYRDNQHRIRQSPEFRAKMAEQTRKNWQDPEYRARQSTAFRDASNALQTKPYAIDMPCKECGAPVGLFKVDCEACQRRKRYRFWGYTNPAGRFYWSLNARRWSGQPLSTGQAKKLRARKRG